VTGQELRALRLRLRMSQEELARKMGKHRNTIVAWENGRSPIGITEALALRMIDLDARAATPKRRRRKP
jgi:transcriptional regulator with XRE-family HTH domain